MTRNVCVYCSSSNTLEASYYDEARKLGRLMAANQYGLVYGGGQIGLMGVLAEAVHEHDGYVYGVIPHALKNKEGVAYELADEMVITDTMRERKGIMFEQSEAFITLPGGIGTLEELIETLTLKHLGYHNHPLIIVNTNGFFDSLMALLEQYREEKFLGATYRTLFDVVDTVEEAIALLDKHFA